MSKGWITAGILGIAICMITICGCHEEVDIQNYAIITKSMDNAYNDQIVLGFQQVIEASGYNCIVRQPQTATAENQIIIINELIQKEVDAIAIAANDAKALSDVLEEAIQAGIKVSTFDSNAEVDSNKVFVNQASEEEIGEVLMKSVYDITGGEGQWAILSATSQAVNQNDWIRAMQKEAEGREYKDMRLVEIVYGDDEFGKSITETRRLLEEYPDLKVICAPTVVGLRAAAQVVAQSDKKDSIKVTGLGMPSEMAAYIGTSEGKVCPYMYLWNPKEIGELSAYVSIELVNGRISGEVGDQFVANKLGIYELHECLLGGSEVILGSPMLINEENIDEWKDKF